MSELKVVVKSVIRKGAVEKVKGTAKFTADLRQPEMLYCKVLRSPYAHARILDVDISAAIRLEGVKAILTHQDVPKVIFW